MSKGTKHVAERKRERQTERPSEGEEESEREIEMGNIEETKRGVGGNEIGKENRNERRSERGEAAKRPLERADTCVLLGTLGIRACGERQRDIRIYVCVPACVRYVVTSGRGSKRQRGKRGPWGGGRGGEERRVEGEW